MLEILPENQTEKWAKKEFPGVFSYINLKFSFQPVSYAGAGFFY